MKKNIFTLSLAALLLGGCGSESSTSDQSVDEILIERTNEEINDESTTTSVTKKIVAGWYMRTIVKAINSDGTEYIHKSAGVFGELDASSDEADIHDIASFMDGILQVVFIPEWDVNGQTYFSDYRSYADGQKQVWTFQVKNPRSVDLSNANLSLSVEGVYDVYKIDTRYEEQLSSDSSKKTSLTLIDVDNQKEYSYQEIDTADLTMDGMHTRTFRWVLGNVDAEDYEPVRSSIPLSSKFVSSTASEKVIQNSDSQDTFGFPPAF